MSWLDKYRDDPLFKSDGSALKSDDPVSFITVIFFILLIIFIFYLIIYIYGYFYEPNKKISSFLWGAYGRDSNEDTPSLPVDPPKAEQMTAQEYNKKADAQMEAIRSGRSDYEETSAKSITKTKGIPHHDDYRGAGGIVVLMTAIGLVIGLVIGLKNGFENITGQGVAQTFVSILTYVYIYYLVGRMARSEYIDRGWYKRDASIFVEILMSPLFLISGVFISLGLISVAVILILPGLAIMFFLFYHILIMFMGI